jgi:hypothetical protein
MLKDLKQLFLIISLFILTTSIVDAAGYQFNRNLYYGLRNDSDVSRLQDMLRKLGFFSLPDSSGNYFGVTVDAVRKFQTANNISPTSGYFGAKTRVEANRLSGSLSTETTPVFVPGAKERALSATSTLWAKIKISNKSISDKPESEYLNLENVSTTSEKISITGFKLVNSNGEQFTIPKGHSILGSNPVASDDILLSQYDTVKIIIGRQERRLDFRQNICEGYIDQFSNFNGHISHSCPKPDIAGQLNLPDHCIRIFEANQSCRTVDLSKIQIPECTAFAEAHYNYQGCVKDFGSRSNFYSRNWLIWMQRPTTFLRKIHDKVTLYDSMGKIVSIYEY